MQAAAHEFESDYLYRFRFWRYPTMFVNKSTKMTGHCMSLRFRFFAPVKYGEGMDSEEWQVGMDDRHDPGTT